MNNLPTPLITDASLDATVQGKFVGAKITGDRLSLAFTP